MVQSQNKKIIIIFFSTFTVMTVFRIIHALVKQIKKETRQQYVREQRRFV